jgi:hypothetical protein
MRLRLLLGITIGAWIAGTLFMWLVATKNFAVVSSILAAPPAGLEHAIQPFPPENLRPVLRYQASEVNRLFFAGWGWTQLPLAAAVLVLAWWSRQGGGFRAATIVAMLIAMFLQFHVVPRTIVLGRSMDFGQVSTDVTETFWMFHNVYTGFDMLKMFLLIGCAVVLIRRS